MILQVEPVLVPVLVRPGQLHVGIVAPAIASSGLSIARLVHLDQGRLEEIGEEVEVGVGAQEALAQGHEGDHLLDPVWGEHVKLHLVVVRHPAGKRCVSIPNSSRW